MRLGRNLDLNLEIARQQALLPCTELTLDAVILNNYRDLDLDQ